MCIMLEIENPMTRQEANRLILQILADQIEKHPDIRFSQLMRNIGVITSYEDPWAGGIVWEDEFNLESVKLLERIQNTIKEHSL